jgi:competence protein ComEA
MWREFGQVRQKYRALLCSVAGVVCFLAAGLMVRSLPGVREKLTEARPVEAKPVGTESVPPGTTLPAPPKEAPTPPLRPVVPDTGTDVFALGPLEEDGRETELILYITGGVRKPGVYKLPVGSRLFRLVELAGGLSGFADPVAINMAATLEDGMHVHVPKKSGRPPDGPAVIVESTVVAPVSRPRSDRNIPRRTVPVDINRATAEELTALKGIGPALAKKIVEDRAQNGRFRSVEDLTRVRGIGDAKLKGFRDFVTVGP